MKQLGNLCLEIVNRVAIPLLLVIAFWQLRHTFYFSELNGQFFEYGSLHVYAGDMVAVLILLLLFVAGIKWWTRPERVPFPIWSLGWVIIGWFLLTTSWSQDWRVSLMTVAEWGLWALVAGVLVRLGATYWKKLKWLIVGVLIATGFGIYQYWVNKSVGWDWLGESVLNPLMPGIVVVIDEGVRRLRAYGLMPHPNIFSGVVVGVLSGILVWVSKTHRGLKWWGLAVPILIAGLVWGFSKSAIMVMGIVLVGVGIYLWRSRYHQPRRIWVLMVATLGLMLVANQGVVLERFNPVSNIEVRSYSERIAGLHEWKDLNVSWMWGAGVGNYALQLANQYPDRQVWEIQPVHNATLLLIREVGLIGIGLIGWWLWLLGSWLWKNKNKILLAVPFMAWLLLGVVDHWTVSLHQGLVMLFLALALIFIEVDV